MKKREPEPSRIEAGDTIRVRVVVDCDVAFADEDGETQSIASPYNRHRARQDAFHCIERVVRHGESVGFPHEDDGFSCFIAGVSLATEVDPAATPPAHVPDDFSLTPVTYPGSSRHRLAHEVAAELVDLGVGGMLASPAAIAILGAIQAAIDARDPDAGVAALKQRRLDSDRFWLKHRPASERARIARKRLEVTDPETLAAFRRQLALEVFDVVLGETESLEAGRLGSDLAYLQAAILRGTVCAWDADEPLVALLKKAIPPPHPVWDHIEVDEVPRPCLPRDRWDLFVTAVKHLCDGIPTEDQVDDWLNDRNTDLQAWVLQQDIPFWATGIGILEAAEALANEPSQAWHEAQKGNAD